MSLRCTALIVVLVSGLSAQELGIPDTHRWVVDLNLRAVLASPLAEPLDVRLAEPTTAARLSLVTTLTGTDVRRDIDRVVLSGIDREPDHALLQVVGRFDRSRLETLAQAAAQAAVVVHRGEEIRTWVGDRGPAAACLTASGILLFSRSAETIRVWLDQQALASLRPQPAMAALLRLSVERPAVLLPDQPRAVLLRQVDRVSIEFSQRANDLVATVVAACADEATAGQVRDLAAGLLALARLNPEAHPQLVAVLGETHIEHNARTVSAQVVIPAAVVLEAARRGQEP